MYMEEIFRDSLLKNSNNTIDLLFSFMQLISEDLESLQQKQVNMLAKLEEYKRKHIQLSHRLLQVVNTQALTGN